MIQICSLTVSVSRKLYVTKRGTHTHYAQKNAARTGPGTYHDDVVENSSSNWFILRAVGDVDQTWGKSRRSLKVASRIDPSRSKWNSQINF